MKVIPLIFASTILTVTVISATAAEIKVAPGSAASSEMAAPKMAEPEMAMDFKGPDRLLSAAQRGDTAAQLEIAILYEYGFNMPDREVYALAWYLLAAESSAKAATHRDQLIRNLSAEKVQEAKKISITLVTASNKTPKSMPAMPVKEAPEMTAPKSSAEPMLEPLPEPIISPESH